jgi:hypothetical protein
MKRTLAAVAPGLWLLAACSPTPTLRASWTGSDTGKAVLRARAALCGEQGPLLIFAASGDTGIGLAVYPNGSLGAGVYPIFDASHGVVRPGAAVAARWTRAMVMADLRGDQGQLTLDAAAPAAAGHFSVRMTGAAAMSAAIAMEGSFKGIPVVAGGPDCVAQSR